MSFGVQGQGIGFQGLPKGSYVVPFWGSILESPITNPKRNYIGAFGEGLRAQALGVGYLHP